MQLHLGHRGWLSVHLNVVMADPRAADEADYGSPSTTG